MKYTTSNSKRKCSNPSPFSRALPEDCAVKRTLLDTDVQSHFAEPRPGPHEELHSDVAKTAFMIRIHR